MRTQLEYRVLTQGLPLLLPLFTQPDTKLCLLPVKVIKQAVVPWTQWVGCLKALSRFLQLGCQGFFFFNLGRGPRYIVQNEASQTPLKVVFSCGF